MIFQTEHTTNMSQYPRFWVFERGARCARGPTIHDKFVGDVTELAYLVRNRLPIPRVLLKNGKCVLGEFIDS